MNLLQKIYSRLRFNNLYLAVLLGVFTLSFAVLVIAEAQALRVAMKRVIFEDRKRSDVVTIINNSPESKTYRIEWRKLIMTEDRSLVRSEKMDPELVNSVKWADGFIRYSPKRVTIPPGQSQQIRLMVRKPSGLEPGEYRAHLFILSEGVINKYDPSQMAQVSGGGQAVQLKIKPGLSLPVIVRHGKLKAEASLSDGNITRDDSGDLIITLYINRSGDLSLYGDMNYYCVSGSGVSKIRSVKGIAVYPEINKRKIVHRFKSEDYPSSGCDSVRAEYVSLMEDSYFKGSVMAEMLVSAR